MPRTCLCSGAQSDGRTSRRPPVCAPTSPPRRPPCGRPQPPLPPPCRPPCGRPPPPPPAPPPPRRPGASPTPSPCAAPDARTSGTPASSVGTPPRTSPATPPTSPGRPPRRTRTGGADRRTSSPIAATSASNRCRRGGGDRGGGGLRPAVHGLLGEADPGVGSPSGRRPRATTAAAGPGRGGRGAPGASPRGRRGPGGRSAARARSPRRGSRPGTGSVPAGSDFCRPCRSDPAVPAPSWAGDGSHCHIGSVGRGQPGIISDPSGLKSSLVGGRVRCPASGTRRPPRPCLTRTGSGRSAPSPARRC